MSNIKNNVTELIGQTPVLRVNNLIKKYDLKADLLIKLESFNPAGSAKDRIAKEMLLKALDEGAIDQNTTIIEPTSGNTGIALAAIATSMNMKCVIVMPDSMSAERINLMKAYGAQVILTPGALGMKGTIDKAQELSASIENSFIAGQFENQANPLAHYKTTGPELYQQTDGKIDIFVASVGTGGTITGTGRYLKENTLRQASAQVADRAHSLTKMPGAHLKITAILARAKITTRRTARIKGKRQGLAGDKRGQTEKLR